jgi:hypothetical protein
MKHCHYADPAKRGPRSPACAPSTAATFIVRRYFLRPHVAPLYLCTAHADYHAHLSPQRMAGAR